MKLWRRIDSDASTPEWSAMSDDKLRILINEGLLHCGWAMEQYWATGDMAYLDEADLGIDQFRSGVAEKKRRASGGTA